MTNTDEFKISEDELLQIEEILRRRATEIAEFRREYTSNKDHLGSVELALTREISRLRSLARSLVDSIDKLIDCGRQDEDGV